MSRSDRVRRSRRVADVRVAVLALALATACTTANAQTGAIHWAFVPPARRVPVPTVEASTWPRNPIDAFVLARLEREGLRPSPAADPARLVRRVSLDLTGLPPTPAELDAFLADARSDAWEHLVDRLLASPRFGERLATPWLDAARYADTHGYQADRYRAVWPWRDWVVDAINRNLRYDEFLTWQIAGDLLPDATTEQRLATAFQRLHRQTEEGGTIEEEFRVEYVVDRVETFGGAMLGLTLGCARCHDHKFDPISQREFYELFAFFQNIDESGQTSHFTDATPVPALALPEAETRQALAELAASIARAEAELASARAEARLALDAWRAGGAPTAVLPAPTARYPLDALDAGGVAPNAVDPGKPGRAFDGAGVVAIDGRPALRLDGENGARFPGVGAFTRSDPFTIAIDVRLPEQSAPAPRAVVWHKSKAALDAGSRGYELVLEHGHPTALLAHMWPENAIKVRARGALPAGRFVQIAVTYDGSSRADGLRIFVDGALAAVDVVRDGLERDIGYERGGAPDLTVGQRFRDTGFAGGHVAGLSVFDRCLTALEVRELAEPGAIGRALAAATGDELADYHAEVHDAGVREATARLRALRSEQRDAVERVPEIMAMVEMASPRPAFRLDRGAYDQPRERVHAGTPAVLPPFGARARDRLGLARWLCDPDHPLTARVAVNRLWQVMFGTGLVATPEDFGTQGDRPTHPELLDWLARRFVDSGWDVKAMLRLIATSATYRQSSIAGPELRARDPDGALLACAPSHRLPAEMLRDQALFAAGLLVEQLGGPPVKPYEPPGLWEEKSGARYEPDRGANAHRRSLYTFWKRTSPPPSMLILDAARRSECEMRRQRTSTPLQALVLLNDPQFVEAARGLGERMLTEVDAGDRARIRFLFRTLTSREPHDDELAVLEALHREQRAAFADAPERAKALIAVGDEPPPDELDPVELATATALANALLSFDEVVVRR